MCGGAENTRVIPSIPPSLSHSSHRTVKSLLTYLALVGFTTVSVVSVVRAVRTELKRGPEFDSAALGAWLVAPSRDDEKPTTLRRAARRLEQEFFDRFDRRAEYESLDAVARQIYEDNWRRLLVTLVRQHSDAYAATPKHLRQAFVDQRLTQFSTWYVFDDGRKMSAADFLLAADNDRRLAAIRLDRPQRDHIRQFAAAMQEAAIKKTWGRFLGGGNTTKPERDP